MQATARISGIGAYAPERKVYNDDVLDLLEKNSAPYLQDSDLELILSKSAEKLERAGSKVRNWCNEDEYCTDIALQASKTALEDADMGPEELDLIIFTGMSKALVEPATGHILRHELKAINANVIDTQDACTSFLKSIELAHSLIKTGAYSKILIAAGERSYDWADFTCKTKEELAWKFGSLTIGDAAGAIVIQSTIEAEYIEDDRHMKFFYKLADGAFSACTIGLNHRVGERYKLFSHSTRLITIGEEMTSKLLPEVFSQEPWKNTKFDNMFFHDVGNMVDGIILSILEKINIEVPDTRMPYFSDYGNVASVSLPLGLWLAKKDGRLKKGNMAAYICPAAGVQTGLMFFKY